MYIDFGEGYGGGGGGDHDVKKINLFVNSFVSIYGERRNKNKLKSHFPSDSRGGGIHEHPT